MTFKYQVSRPCIGPAELGAVTQAMLNCQLTQGEHVLRFERILGEHLGVPHVVVTSSGTTALHLALVALGVGPGDEVLVPDLTYVATANAVLYTGATVRLVDVARDGCLDLEDVDRRVTKAARAIMPVHLYGVPSELPDYPFIKVVEDAAEAIGGTYHGRALGTIGDAGIFSFYGNKTLTTGEGGAVVTHDALLAKRLRHLRGMAQTSQRYYHDQLGFNYRMTDIQAAIGVGQMTHLLDMLARRRTICATYADRFSQDYAPNQAPWLFTLQLPVQVNRDQLMSQLAARGIETRPTFVPLHRMPMFEGTDRDFPGACAFGDHGISLPTYPELEVGDVHVIADEVLSCM